MRIGIISDGNLKGTTLERKYHEIVREAVLADELGFSCWGTAEVHFLAPGATVSAPDAIYGAVAAQTERIAIRYMALVVTHHHPITVAERLATLDILSEGRAELCSARGNNLAVMNAFGIDPATTRDRWQEAMEVIGRTLTDGTVSSDGEFWPFGEVDVVPTPIQKPAPPLFVASSSPPSARAGARNGLGVLLFDNYFGWDYVDECIAAYRESIADAVPVGGRVTDHFSYFVPSAHCAETNRTARDEIRDRARAWIELVLDALYKPLKSRKDYEYFAEMERVERHRHDLDALMGLGPTLMAGDPDYFIEAIKKLEARGVDEVILAFDGISHAHNLKAIELVGKHVLPEFQDTAVAAGTPAHAGGGHG